MSETGKKLDVEDVLSSIRRLVSEEARNDDATVAAPMGRVEPPLTSAEKLVLTPSLRVPEADKPVPTSEIERRIADIENLVNTEVRPTPKPANDPSEMIAAINLSGLSGASARSAHPVRSST